MYRIYFAIGNDKIEDFIKENKKFIEKFRKTEVEFVGEALYKGGIVNGVQETNADLVIINEYLSGTEDIRDIIYELRCNCPKTRILFLTGYRAENDPLLESLIQLGVYDFVASESIKVSEILKKIIQETDFNSIKKYISIKPNDKTNNDNNKIPKRIIKPKVVKKIDETEIKENSSKVDEEIIVEDNLEEESVNNNKKEDKEDFIIEDKEDINIEDKEDSEEIIIEDKEEEENEEILIDEENEEILIEDKKDEEEEEEKSEDEKVLIEDKEEEEETHSEESNIKNILKNNNLEKFPTKNLEIKSEDKGILPLRPNLNSKKEQSSTIKTTSTSTKKTKKKENNKPKKTELKLNEDLGLKNEKPLKEYNETNTRTSSGGIFGKIFNKQQINRVQQQVICFCGGNRGTGNSQIAFNTALSLASEGLKVMYMDLNDKFSSIECIFQLGYQDAGIDTAIYGITTEEYNLINRSIVDMGKILLETENDNYLFITYSKIPKNLSFMFFSGNYINREKEDENLIDYTYLKDLNYYLTMKEQFDIIILDVPCDIENVLTQTALIYSSKVFFTITQDVSTIRNHLNFIVGMDKKQISFRDKFYYVLNKYENATFSVNEVFELLSESIRVQSFNIIPIPNLNKELINSNYLGIPLIWQSKNKTFLKGMSFIREFIMK